MKRKQVLALLMTGLLLSQGLWMTACGQAEPSVSTKAVTETSEAESAIAETESVRETEAVNIDEAVKTDGMNGFSFQLTNALLAKKEQGVNLVASPYSVWLPLAALVNATDDEAREALLSAIGKAGITAEELNDAVKALNSALLQEERAAYSKEEGIDFESPLKIANALFVGKNEKIRDSFVKIFEETYGGKLFSVDFADISAVEQVNRWADEHTDGKIMQIIESFDPQTVAAIANAIYFSDGWATQFPEENTKAGTFHGASFDEDVFFMNHKFNENTYYENEDFQATVLPTQNNGQMILLLPGEGKTPEDVLSGMDTEKLSAIEGGEFKTVQLSLPKFTLESGIFSVKEAMEALGVPLTDPNNPHLDGLVEDSQLFISEAVQKSFIDVDENGLTAAAVTVMGIERMSMPIETEPVELNFDKPFAFILTADGGEAGQQVLFTGVVNSTMTAVACN